MVVVLGLVSNARKIRIMKIFGPFVATGLLLLARPCLGGDAMSGQQCMALMKNLQSQSAELSQQLNSCKTNAVCAPVGVKLNRVTQQLSSLKRKCSAVLPGASSPSAPKKPAAAPSGVGGVDLKGVDGKVLDLKISGMDTPKIASVAELGLMGKATALDESVMADIPDIFIPLMPDPGEFKYRSDYCALVPVAINEHKEAKEQITTVMSVYEPACELMPQGSRKVACQQNLLKLGGYRVMIDGNINQLNADKERYCSNSLGLWFEKHFKKPMGNLKDWLLGKWADWYTSWMMKHWSEYKPKRAEGGRPLNDYEKSEMRKIFGDKINYDAVVVKTGDKNTKAGRGSTFDDIIYLGDQDVKLDLLAHEMAHVYQYQKLDGWDYYWKGKEQLKEEGDPQVYDYTLVIGRPFHNYDIEEQAKIIQDYWYTYYHPNDPKLYPDKMEFVADMLRDEGLGTL